MPALLALSPLALALALGCRASLYAPDATFAPQWPAGSHKFSAVGVGSVAGRHGRAGAILFVTQRGNASIPPVLVLNATTGALLDSWGEDSVALDRSTPSAPTWGAHGNRVHLDWATPQVYDNPHSIAYHRSGMLILADREHNQTRLLDASSGQDLGSWDCGLNLGMAGKPFGVRTLSTQHHDLDLVFLSIMDIPQDGRNQKIAVLDGSGLQLAKGGSSACKVLQVIEVDTAHSGPHMMGVDPETGDLYVALVADQPLSTVLRFMCTDCNKPLL